MPYVTAYDCSKVAVTRLTDFLARETREYGIQVFVFSVGPTHTEMIDYMLESEVGRKWLPDLAKWLENDWMPIEWAGAFVMVLASSKADVLSGRRIGVRDNLDDMLNHIEEIERESLYVWSFRRLKNEK